MQAITIQEQDNDFRAEVERRSGQSMVECYQCGNCTAGCPFDFAYDLPVSKIMRLVQLGQRRSEERRVGKECRL